MLDLSYGMDFESSKDESILNNPDSIYFLHLLRDSAHVIVCR